MKKIKSPWYGVVWILIWTAALIWFLVAGMFTTRESVGLVVVWLIMVGITAYLLVQHLRSPAGRRAARQEIAPSEPARNAPCPCGSGKKYKRCCATE